MTDNAYCYRKKTDIYTLDGWQISGRVIRSELERATLIMSDLRNEWASGEHDLNHPLTQFLVRSFSSAAFGRTSHIVASGLRMPVSSRFNIARNRSSDADTVVVLYDLVHRGAHKDRKVVRALIVNPKIVPLIPSLASCVYRIPVIPTNLFSWVPEQLASLLGVSRWAQGYKALRKCYSQRLGKLCFFFHSAAVDLS